MLNNHVIYQKLTNQQKTPSADVFSRENTSGVVCPGKMIGFGNQRSLRQHLAFIKQIIRNSIHNHHIYDKAPGIDVRLAVTAEVTPVHPTALPPSSMLLHGKQATWRHSTVAMTFPVTVGFNDAACPAKYARVAGLLQDKEIKRPVNPCRMFIHELIAELGIPTFPSAAKPSQRDLAAIAQDAYPQRLTAANPCDVSLQDFQTMLEQIFSGK